MMKYIFDTFKIKLKSFFLIFLKYSITMIFSGIVGISLLALAYTMPINSHTKESSLLHKESMGWSPLVNNRYTQYKSYFTSFEPGALDDSTDLIILNNSFAEGEGTALERAVDMNNYGRYWHGYVSVLRFIFYFLDYWDFLLLNSFMQLFLMGCVGYAIQKVTGKKRYLLAFFSSCVFLTPMATGMSLQYSPCFYISMLGSLFCILKADWILQKNRRYFLFLILGIVTCYFDFLTYPLLCFAFPFCWLLVAAENKMTAESKIGSLFGTGCSFIFGYGGFFVIKWIIQAIISGTNSFWSGLSVVFFHVAGLDNQYRLLHQNYSRIDSLYNNFRHFLNPIFILVLSVWIIVLLYKFIRGELKITADNIVFAAITLTAPAWYFIVNTHTGIHHFFTYRIYGASILGFMLFVCSTYSQEKATPDMFSANLKRLALLCVCVALGVGISRLAKEDFANIDCGEYIEIQLEEEDILGFEFTPSISEVKGFSLCILTNDSVEGAIHVDLYDGETVCEQMSIPIETYKNMNFQLQLTDWDLKAGKQYLMKVYITDNCDGIRVLVTPKGTRPQTEYGKAFINQDETLDSAPLSGIVYRGHMQSKAVKFYLSVCAGVFLLVLSLSVQVFWKNYKQKIIPAYIVNTKKV